MKNAWIPMFLAVACLAAVPAQAAPIFPTHTTFGTLAGATFGGTGIPNDAVAITVIDLGGGESITLGLTAHKRYANPPLGNNGKGTFSATPGINDGLDGVPHPLGATWNVGFYVEVTDGTLGDYEIELLYDLDAGKQTDLADHGLIDLDVAAAGFSIAQGSENMHFAYLASGIPGTVFPPPGPFDGNAKGQYTFALRVFDQTQTLLGQSAIQVNVPEPATLGLLLLAGAAGVRRFRSRA